MSTDEPWPMFNDVVALAERTTVERWPSWGDGLLPALQAAAGGDRQAYYRLLCRAMQLDESTVATAARDVIAMYGWPHGEQLVAEIAVMYGAEPLQLYAVLRQALDEPAHTRLGFMLQIAAEQAGQKITGEA